jgi:serine/threonine-protein kinase
MAAEASDGSNNESARSTVPSITEETYFGRAVVERGMATEEEVQKCLADQRSREQKGQRVPLQELLINHKVLTPNQVRRMAGEMEDSAGRPAQQIPNFQIIQKIGAGAMATVYKARQLSLDRIVAIKVLPKRLSENPEFVERFYREGRAAAKLNHQNIVQAFDVGQAYGFHYFVMEFVDGKTVYDDLTAQRPIAEKTALDIVLQIAGALQHAHNQGFIHRDVKPKNIMIDKNGVAKLADMGLAREANDVKAAMAEAGRAYGTPYYISPEQIRGEMDVDFRADIYSLGAMLYHMVTGKVPFDGPTPSAVMHKHLKQPLTPPDHLNTNLSTGLGEVIEIMMSKDRAGRYASTTDLITDLQAVANGEPPLFARSRYDHGLLSGLADGQESFDMNDTVSLKYGGRPSNMQTLLLIGLVFSLLLNLVLVIAVATG